MKKNQARVRSERAACGTPTQACNSTPKATPKSETAPIVGRSSDDVVVDLLPAIDAVDQSSRRLVALADLVSNRLSEILEEQSREAGSLGAGFVDLVRTASADLAAKVDALSRADRAARRLSEEKMAA